MENGKGHFHLRRYLPIVIYSIVLVIAACTKNDINLREPNVFVCPLVKGAATFVAHFHVVHALHLSFSHLHQIRQLERNRQR